MKLYEWEIKYLIDKRDNCKKQLGKMEYQLTPTNTYKYYAKQRELKALETILEVMKEEAEIMKRRLGE